MRGSSTRDDWGIVWKLLPDKTLKPIRVKLGVTDFTFTACINCSAAKDAKDAPDIKQGDDLIIGQTSKNTSQQAQGSQQQRPPGMGGPGGPGQMRRF
jgi:hypothetical protein